MTIFWKISHYLYKKDCKLLLPLDRAFEFINYLIGSNAISAKADIGKGTKFWHRGLGCTVHYKATIGDNCWILPNVMIGSKFEKGIPGFLNSAILVLERDPICDSSTIKIIFVPFFLV